MQIEDKDEDEKDELLDNSESFYQDDQALEDKQFETPFKLADEFTQFIDQT